MTYVDYCKKKAHILTQQNKLTDALLEYDKIYDIDIADCFNGEELLKQKIKALEQKKIILESINPNIVPAIQSQMDYLRDVVSKFVKV